ncbi:unnamed protein product [Caenorhabditis angaria]|uniref:N-acetyltransferase domain-containing protein n=1 Tax=Caenorhabditis angaria TaxID=860376 RepID=A0A9P1IYL7_9PELO|nr:unnamed protein product [Caenorhabditis angaria]
MTISEMVQKIVNADKNVYIEKGIKVLINPPKELFDEFQEWISETERWNYRSNEYSIWKSTLDNFWFYLAIDEETNEIVSAVSLAEQHSLKTEPIFTIGNYYCVPEWRGRGVSNKLFKMAIAQAGTHNIGLFGATQMAPLYASQIDISQIIIPQQQQTGLKVREIEEEDWQNVHEYDEQICVIERRKYIRKSLTDVSTISRICQNSSGKLLGFGAIKKVVDGEIYLSPLYADTYEVAVSLVANLLKSMPDLQNFTTLITLYPEINNNIPRLMNLISGGSFRYHSEYRNQYTKKIYEFPMERVWACEELSHCLV